MSPRALARTGEERGGVLVAGLLLALALLMLVGAAVDVGRAFVARRELVALADEAALAGSQALDLEARHAGRLALDPPLALRAARAVLAGERALTYEASASQGRVSVTVRRRLPTVLLPVVGLPTLTVSARASGAPREP